jgi:hypothetical protein
MKYQVTLHNAGNVQVTFPTASIKKSVNVDTTPSNDKISDLNDVDDSAKQNNGVLIWNEGTQKHEYVLPFELLDLADGVNDDAIDYGTY